MPGNWHVPFGKWPSEKDPNHGHLVGGLIHPVSGAKPLYLATVIDLAHAVWPDGRSPTTCEQSSSSTPSRQPSGPAGAWPER